MPVSPWPSIPPAEPSFVLVFPDGSLAYVPAASLGLEVPPPTPPPPSTPPAPASLTATATVLSESEVRVEWSPAGTDDTFGHRVLDANGSNGWTSPTGQTSPQTLTNFRPGTVVPVVVTSGGRTATTTVTTKAAAPAPPTPVPPPPAPAPTPPTPPTPATSRFKPFTLGASVTDAANGNFNRWLGGKRHGMYVNWGTNGRIYAIDPPSSEYGTGKIPALGDFDLAVAPQRTNTEYRSWAGAAKGNMDALWRADLVELRTKWGTRKGTVFYDPWHELNGNWYGWSVPKGQEALFRAASQRFRKVWDEVIKGDTRFVLVLVFNRNAVAAEAINRVRAQDLLADGVWDALGVDYYDFGFRTGATDWPAEANRTELNGSPVGILQWIALAKARGVPLLLQEWGVQFGDNVRFITEMTKVFDQHGYRGGPDVAGKILAAGYHNLQGASPDPSAGGDFFITSGGKDYSRRPAASKALREWATAATWIRTA